MKFFRYEAIFNECTTKPTVYCDSESTASIICRCWNIILKQYDARYSTIIELILHVNFWKKLQFSFGSNLIRMVAKIAIHILSLRVPFVFAFVLNVGADHISFHWLLVGISKFLGSQCFILSITETPGIRIRKE